MPSYSRFEAMSSDEAARYFDAFTAEMPGVLGQLQRAINVEFTFLPESLDPVWEAIRLRLRWRPGYTPSAVGQPSPTIPAECLEPPNELPSWFHHPSGVGYARFSANTLWLIDGAGRYLGETMVRNGLGRWRSGHEDTDDYMYENQPVIALSNVEASPFQSCAVIASQSLKSPRATEGHSLSDVYNAWAGA